MAGSGHGREVALSHPPCHEGHHRKPEEQVDVRPEHVSRDAMHGVQQMVVVVPVGGDKNEAEYVSEKGVPQLLEGTRTRTLRHL
jgi:hypothetical protein